ncbi:protein complex assembly-related protein [Gigaspora margarita]|uniref:Protein complex assembly-related protein n=1 Tax=Gigaspora margarita TaxID=4874 RepID=A0A8H3XFN7_GIGMA|nr:protein complex assembly-related protein [Gigaspora margarita]
MTQGKFWAALYILDEKVIDGSPFYLVQWEGNDKSGNPWLPTWEPGENCTQSLINEWNTRRLKIKKEDRENSVSVSDSTVTDGSDLRCSHAMALEDELPIKFSNNPNESLIMNQDIHVNSNIVSHDPQRMLKRSQTEWHSQNLVGEKELIYHTNKKNRTEESLINDESHISSDENNNFSYQKFFVQPAETFKIQSCTSQTSISSQDISTQTLSSNTNFSDKKILPNLSSNYQSSLSINDESLQSVSSLANNTISPALNSTLSIKDPIFLVKELQNRANTIAILCEERDRFQKTLAQIKKNWQIQQEKAISLSKENEKIKQQLQQQTRDEKDVQHRLELEKSRRKYEIIRKNDCKVIEELEKSTKYLAAENLKLKQELEELKSLKASANIYSSFNKKPQQSPIVRPSFDSETLLSENKRLESDIKTLNLQSVLQQQNLKLMEEKLLHSDSTLRFFMDLNKIA